MNQLLFRKLGFLVIFPLSLFTISCSNFSSPKVIESKSDPCLVEPSEALQKASVISSETNDETLRGIRYHTRRKVILMPITSATFSQTPAYMMQGDLTGFATEIMNQSFRNEGIKTVAWFKVSKELNEVMNNANNSSNNPYSAEYLRGSGQYQVSDQNINELIIAAKNLGACYIVRPVILKSSSTSNTKTSYNPVGVALGFGALSSKTKTISNAEVDLKIDIISVREEDIIASKTFSGRSALVSKDRANILDGITGSNIFSGGTQTDQTRIAFYDTIDKIVEFLEDKML